MDVNGFNIQLLIEYGVLGIIGYFFIRWSNKMFEKQDERFGMLMKSLMETKVEPITDLKESINLLHQLLNSNNKYMTETINNLTSEIGKSLNEKSILIEIVSSMEKNTKERDHELLNILNILRHVVLEMKKNCYALQISNKRLGDRLVEKGFITQTQLIEVLQEQEDEESELLGIKK